MALRWSGRLNDATRPYVSLNSVTPASNGHGKIAMLCSGDSMAYGRAQTRERQNNNQIIRHAQARIAIGCRTQGKTWQAQGSRLLLRARALAPRRIRLGQARRLGFGERADHFDPRGNPPQGEPGGGSFSTSSW